MRGKYWKRCRDRFHLQSAHLLVAQRGDKALDVIEGDDEQTNAHDGSDERAKALPSRTGIEAANQACGEHARPQLHRGGKAKQRRRKPRVAAKKHSCGSNCQSRENIEAPDKDLTHCGSKDNPNHAATNACGLRRQP